MTAETARIREANASDAWSCADAEALYRIEQWGDRFFFVNEAGHVAVRAEREGGDVIDVHAVAVELRRRRVPFPVLVRFHDVLRARVARVNDAFANAIAESGYRGRYNGVYPIKVNQLHEVIEEILDAGAPYGVGLECGSKSELVAALAHLDSDERLLVCNGVKDVTMIELALSAQGLGKNVIPVVEKYDEFERILEVGERLGLAPRFGLRVRLDTRGAGKWADSGSHLSKFGLGVSEVVRMVAALEARGRLDAIALLHFHIGSQVPDVQVIRHAVREIGQVYVQLVKRGATPRYVDVGGGLGVNYDAAYTDAEGSIGYSLQEYANAVVYTVMEVCDEEDVPHPVLVSESGRAITAHHSVLVVEVVGAYRREEAPRDLAPSEGAHQVVHELHEALTWARDLPPAPRAKVTQLLEIYHDAAEAKGRADAFFEYGYVTLEEKAITEQMFWSTCREVNARLEGLDASAVPLELRDLAVELVDQYLCNFSVFQSILDHWAIGQCFPIVPLARLDERPTRRAVLVDLTCDSDGKVERYVSADEDRASLPLHAPRAGEPYLLGFFLMGAYQDIMGDAHNLFGRVAEAHVYADVEEPEGYYIEKIIPAQRVQDMLALVQYFPNDLQRRMETVIREKASARVIRPKAGVDMMDEYRAVFEHSTYLRSEGPEPDRR